MNDAVDHRSDSPGVLADEGGSDRTDSSTFCPHGTPTFGWTGGANPSPYPMACTACAAEAAPEDAAPAEGHGPFAVGTPSVPPVQGKGRCSRLGQRMEYARTELGNVLVCGECGAGVENGDDGFYHSEDAS